MLRFLVSRRALGLLAALVVVAAAFTALATWQWDRAHSRTVDPLSRPTVALDDVSRSGTGAVPSSAVARAVRVSGTYDRQRTYVVLSPTGSGAQPWSMTPLLLDDGSVIPVVHGRVGSIADARDVVVPTGRVVVVGRLQASQAPAGDDPSESGAVDPAAGVLGSIATSELAGLVDEPIRPGFVLATAENPVVVGVAPVPPAALVVPPRGVRIQNLLYTVQWSLFSAFAFFVYWRLMRDAWRDHAAAGHGEDDDSDDDSSPGSEPDLPASDRNPLKETTA